MVFLPTKVLTGDPVNIDTKQYTKGEDKVMSQITLLLKSKKKQTKEGRQFRTYFTDVMMIVKGEESKGKQRKTLTVKFDKDCPNVSKLVRGLLTVDEKDIDLPFKYQIQEKDGKPSYPHIYIRKFEKYEEQKGKSTIQFITEEDETEDTVIDDEDESSDVVEDEEQ